MNATRTVTNRLALAVTAASVALGGLVGLGPQQARADDGQRLENFEIQRLTSSYNQADADTTTTLDSDSGTQETEFKIPKLLDAASPKLSEFDVDGNELAVGESSETSGAKGGNVEFEWKVEEGER